MDGQHTPPKMTYLGLLAKAAVVATGPSLFLSPSSPEEDDPRPELVSTFSEEKHDLVSSSSSSSSSSSNGPNLTLLCLPLLSPLY